MTAGEEHEASPAAGQAGDQGAAHPAEAAGSRGALQPPPGHQHTPQALAQDAAQEAQELNRLGRCPIIMGPFIM